MTAVAWGFGAHAEDGDDGDAPTRGEWGPLERFVRRLRWVYVTRALGVFGFYVEVVVNKLDRPTTCFLIGMLLLGPEVINNRWNGGTR